MQDNRGDWGTFSVIAQGHATFSERLAQAGLRFAQSLVDAMQVLSYRSDLYRSRQQLGELTDEQLLDVGLTRVQVKAETSRAFFRD